VLYYDWHPKNRGVILTMFKKIFVAINNHAGVFGGVLLVIVTAFQLFLYKPAVDNHWEEKSNHLDNQLNIVCNDLLNLEKTLNARKNLDPRFTTFLDSFTTCKSFKELKKEHKEESGQGFMTLYWTWGETAEKVGKFIDIVFIFALVIFLWGVFIRLVENKKN